MQKIIQTYKKEEKVDVKKEESFCKKENYCRDAETYRELC